MIALDFFATLWGRVALGAGLVAALVAVRAADVHHQRSVGAQKEAARVEAKGKKIDEAAQTARRAAESQPDSLRKYYRD